jgi:hypothetical protein
MTEPNQKKSFVDFGALPQSRNLALSGQNNCFGSGRAYEGTRVVRIELVMRVTLCENCLDKSIQQPGEPRPAAPDNTEIVTGHSFESSCAAILGLGQLAASSVRSALPPG